MVDKIIQKLKSLFPQKNSEKNAPTPENKNKKRAWVIKAIAGLAVLYVAVDEFVLKEKPVEQPPVTPTVVKKKQRKARKSLKDMEQPKETALREVSSESTPTIETPPANEPPKEVLTKEEPPKEDIPMPPPAPQLEIKNDSSAPIEPTEDIAKNMEEVAKEIGPIPTEEIKPAEKVELPDYTIKGRGLVYNCKGKHWACIDRSGYLNCREHMRWSEENKKNPECVIKNVYGSEEDCAIIQLHYINTNETSDFCKKN